MPPSRLLHHALAGFGAFLLSAACVAGDDPDLIFAASMEPYVELRGNALYPAPLNAATVTVRVPTGGLDNFVYTTTTDANGAYRITVPVFDEQRVPTLNVRGAGTQSHIEYASTPGSLAALQALADTNLVLTSTTEPYLDLNPFTTGLYVAMRAVIGGAGVRSAAEFTRAARGFYYIDAHRRGYLNALIASRDIPLPNGATTSLGAMLNVTQGAAAFEAAAALGACPNARCTAEQALLSNPTIVPVLAPPTGIEWQAYSTFRPEVVFGTAVFLSPTGSGTLYREADSNDIVWTESQGLVTAARGDGMPIRTDDVLVFRECNNGQLLERRETIEVLLRFVRGPGQGVLMQHGDRKRISYPGSPTCVTRIDTTAPGAGASAVRSDVVPYALATLAGTTRVLPTCATVCTAEVNTEISGTFALEPHTFAANGTGSLSRIARTFTWNLDTQGRLQLLYSNGAAAQFTKVSEESPDYAHVNVRYQDSNGLFYAASGVIMEQDPDAQFTAENVPGSYTALLNTEYPFAFLDPDFGRPMFGYTFLADGTGNQFFNGTPSHFHRWFIQFPPNRFLFDRYSNSGSSVIQQRRTWELIRVSAAGDVYYVLENVDFSPPIAPPSYGPTRRLAGYRKTVTPPTP